GLRIPNTGALEKHGYSSSLRVGLAPEPPRCAERTVCAAVESPREMSPCRLRRFAHSGGVSPPSGPVGGSPSSVSALIKNDLTRSAAAPAPARATPATPALTPAAPDAPEAATLSLKAVRAPPATED